MATTSKGEIPKAEAIARPGRPTAKAPERPRPKVCPTAPLISTDEAAARLGVPPRFIRRLVDERRIPFHKIGRYVRFDPADIDRFAMDGRVNTHGTDWPRSA